MTGINTNTSLASLFAELARGNSSAGTLRSGQEGTKTDILSVLNNVLGPGVTTPPPTPSPQNFLASIQGLPAATSTSFGVTNDILGGIFPQAAFLDPFPFDPNPTDSVIPPFLAPGDVEPGGTISPFVEQTPYGHVSGYLDNILRVSNPFLVGMFPGEFADPVFPGLPGTIGFTPNPPRATQPPVVPASQVLPQQGLGDVMSGLLAAFAGLFSSSSTDAPVETPPAEDSPADPPAKENKTETKPADQKEPVKEPEKKPPKDPFADVDANTLNLVKEAYSEILGRSEKATLDDVDGVLHHTRAIEEGRTTQEVAKVFFGSEEFANQELTPEETIKRLYRFAEDREPTEAELTRSVNQLNNKSIDVVINRVMAD